MQTFQLKPSFAGGELTPALYGRTDLQKYDVGAAVLENAIVQRYGGVTRRPGFRHVAQTAGSHKARLIPFSYNAEQNYVLEFTDQKVRVFANGEPLYIDNTLVEVTTPYTEAELPQIKYTQSADMLFLAHPNHHPAAITRTLTGWTWEELDITNGPFDDPNTTEITLTPDRATTTIYNTYVNKGEIQDPFFPSSRCGQKTTTDVNNSKTGTYIYSAMEASFNPTTVPISETKWKNKTLKDIWFRFDCNTSSAVKLINYIGCFVVQFDDKPQWVGYFVDSVYYFNEYGGYIDTSYYNRENYVGPYDSYAAPDHYSPYNTLDALVKWVIHIGTGGVWVYHNDHLVYSKECTQGSKITSFRVGGGATKRYSNIFIADYDCSAMTLEHGDIDIPDGRALLTASGPIFTDEMVGQLVRLGHTVPAQYSKGVPGTHDTLTVRCVPGSSVYVESFGFWEGYFQVEKLNDEGNWVVLKKQSGNRSSNYNMTFQNDDDVIREYRVTSDDFDISVKTGEDENQRGYVTIQAFSNDYDGILRILEVVDSTHAKTEIYKELGATTATLDWSLQAWSIANGYPQAVGFYEDRLVFGGSPKKPQTYWTSKTGDYLNFGNSYPGRDDDAITGSLASGKMNDIKAIVSFGEMVMLTSGGEYRVSGGNGQNFTPTTQQARAQEYRGITDVPPVVIGGRILYVQRGGRIIRDLAYSYDVDKYTGDEVNILASHLFDGQEIVSMAYQQTPESVLWCVRSDGVLLGMTYIKEQDVYAWHRHTTQGQFIDVCTIPGTVEDELWAVVKRGNNYYVEQMAKHSDNIYTDAAAIHDGTAKNYMDGLTWLAGQTVKVVGDGEALEDVTVSGAGRIDLAESYGRIVTGYGYDTTVTTLPIEMNGQDGTWGSRKKRIQNMCVMFKETRGGWFGFNNKPMDEIKWIYGEGDDVFDGKKKMNLPQANYNETLMLTIKQLEPYPMTILSVIPEVLPGG